MNLIDAINQFPDYIGKGILELLVLTLGGVIVAWITTIVFGRKSEINAVEGALLKRKMDIYEELSGKLEMLKAEVIIPDEVYDASIKILKEENIHFNPINSNQLLSIFDSPNLLTDSFFETDKYIASKKLYYDNDVMIQTIRFQNYFAVFRRLLVLYEQEMMNKGISLEEKRVKAIERVLTVSLGIILQDELIEQIDKVIAAMNQSLLNPNFKHRKQIEYSYNFFNDPNGPIMGELKNTKILKHNGEILALVTKAVAMTIVGVKLTGKQK